MERNTKVAEIISTHNIEQKDIVDLIRGHYLPVLDAHTTEYEETLNLFVEITKKYRRTQGSE